MQKLDAEVHPPARPARSTCVVQFVAAVAACLIPQPSFAEPVILNGTSGADFLDASSSAVAHIIYGFGGSDRILGSSADDVLDGGSEGDVIDAGPGSDTLIGGPGNDTLTGGAGDDDFFVSGSSAWDTLSGGDGYDRLLGSSGNDIIGIRSMSGVEFIDGGAGSDRLRLAGGVSSQLDLSATVVRGIELIEGSASKDTIIGSASGDTITGGRGDDYIDGAAGLDEATYPSAYAAYVVTQNANGSITIRDPVTGGTGTDLLVRIETVRFTDGYLQSGIFTPSGGSNRPPLAAADSASVAEDGSVVVNVLANDSDPDGDALSLTSFAGAKHGKITLSAPASVTYKPNADYAGVDSFTYTVSDGRGGTASANVSVNVTPQADAPRPRDDSAVTVINESVVVEVLGNDLEVDGQALTVSSVTRPASGTAAIQSGGRIQYVPNAGYQGTDSFEYTVTDTTGLSASARVTVAVQSSPATTPLRDRIAAAPEGSWLRINQNRFRDVWPSTTQQPATPSYLNPAKVIFCWSSMAWDPNRNQLIFWGGGHGNYSGNEVYRFDGNTFRWQRASLPSDVVNLLGDGQYFAVDGAMSAPTSSHTYDNQEFLPNLDRFITFGGAKFNARQQFVLEDGATRTGPYLWDPGRAGGDSVGGLAGSQVRPDLYPDVIGGQMWQNRDTIRNAGIGAVRPSGDFVNSTSAYVNMDGKDAILVTEAPRTQARLFLYTINDVADPAQDTWDLVGIDSSGYGNQGAGAYDPARKLFARTAKTTFGWGLVVWDLSVPGPTNKSFIVIPRDGQGLPIVTDLHGMDFDRTRGVFTLWDGGPTVWRVQPPANPRTGTWVTTQAETSPSTESPSQADGVLVAYGDPKPQHGVLGKWKYAADYDVFFGVINPLDGNVWVYKPRGWSPAGN